MLQQSDREGPDHQLITFGTRRHESRDEVHQRVDRREARRVVASSGRVLSVVAAHQVVADVVGDDGHAVAAEIRLHGEEGVLAGGELLVESEAQSHEQFAPEQLLGAQREDDPGGVDVGTLLRAAEHRPRDAPVDPLHLAEHHVRRRPRSAIATMRSRASSPR